MDTNDALLEIPWRSGGSGSHDGGTVRQYYSKRAGIADRQARAKRECDFPIDAQGQTRSSDIFNLGSTGGSKRSFFTGELQGRLSDIIDDQSGEHRGHGEL
jgi:hypothetical protein